MSRSNFSSLHNEMDADVGGQMTVSPVALSCDDSVMDEPNVSATETLNTDACFDNLMHKAYSANLINCADGDSHSVWCTHWRQLVQHSSNHYILPGGSTGHKYADVLMEEVSHLAVDNYPSEYILTFSSVVLKNVCDVIWIHAYIQCIAS